MNKEQLIDKMRSLLPNNQWAHQDFENYDLPKIQQNIEPFLWAVRESGTSMCYIGETAFQALMADEACRLEVFRDSKTITAFITYPCHEISIYYWDGISFVQITAQEAEELVKNVWGNAIERLKDTHPEEVQMCNEPLPIIYASPETMQAVEKTREFAESIGDDSFEKCIKRLSNYRRTAVNHHILIYRDYRNHDYGFAEKVNGENRLVGGIIKHETGWQIHT